MKTKLLSLISIFLVSLTQTVCATPLICDPLTSCSSIETWHDIEEQIPMQQDHILINEQQEILFNLMKTQAEDRYAIRKTARLALINLQRFVASGSYNQSTAKELAIIYGKAMAELAYLDIQLAVQFRNILSEKQQKSLQDKNQASSLNYE
jgi:Spy/CpxP family protein refolding chaperone